MVYDKIIIDSANLFYRKKKEGMNSTEICKKMIKFIDNDCHQHISPDGEIYILMDPLSKSIEDKVFVYGPNKRKEIDPEYKKGREKAKEYYSAISLFKKYYVYRGDSIKLVYGSNLEADDFVEPLLKRFDEKQNVAIYTTDLDFARYISKNVHLINKDFDKPYTSEDFEKVFKFKPTVASVTFYKALFGDTSDNITGAINLKKAKFMSNINMCCYNCVKYIADNNFTIDEVLNMYNSFNVTHLRAKEERTPLEILFIEFEVASLKEEVNFKLLSNVKIIRSQLENTNIDKFIHSNPVNEKFNEIVKQSIFGVKFTSWFGKV